jgi:folate-binding protein YgfZ
MISSWYLHQSPIVFKISGKDARRYLNNRLSNDLRTAAPGTSLIAGALTPQGKVEGLFTVYVVSEDLFYLVSEAGSRQLLFAAVGRYIVADRVSIVDVSSESLVGHLSGDDTLKLELPDTAQLLSMPRRRIAPTGTDFLITSADVAAMSEILKSTLGEPLDKETYDLHRFSEGFAQFPDEIDDSVILTEAGLREAVSFTKGCYVGQEVLERSDAIGKLPRTMERVVFRGTGEIGPGARVVSPGGQALGKVVSVFPNPARGQCCAFCLLKTGAYVVGDSVQCNEVGGEILSKEQRTV